jgi:hypothetical protein
MGKGEKGNGWQTEFRGYLAENVIFPFSLFFIFPSYTELYLAIGHRGSNVV